MLTVLARVHNNLLLIVFLFNVVHIPEHTDGSLPLGIHHNNVQQFDLHRMQEVVSRSPCCCLAPCVVAHGYVVWLDQQANSADISSFL
jgi:hypothetical protein